MYATEDCSRCGGSGTYSWCQRFGDTCFKCSGKGQQFTKEARAAMDAVAAWRAERASVRADSVQVGDLIRATPSDRVRKVTEVCPPREDGSASIRPDGTRVPLLGLVVRGMRHLVEPDHLVQRQLTPAECAELEAFTESLPGVFRA